LLGGRRRPLDHMRSCLGSAGFANQELTLKPRRRTLLPELRCLLCKAFFEGCSLFETASLWHAQLHPFEACGSATRLVSSPRKATYRAAIRSIWSAITKYVAILKSARTKILTFCQSSIAQTASPVCGTKNFSSVRAPQLLCTIVAITGICASGHRFSSPELTHFATSRLRSSSVLA
jgi:hypothetical protein